MNWTTWMAEYCRRARPAPQHCARDAYHRLQSILPDNLRRHGVPAGHVEHVLAQGCVASHDCVVSSLQVGPQCAGCPFNTADALRSSRVTSRVPTAGPPQASRDALHTLRQLAQQEEQLYPGA